MSEEEKKKVISDEELRKIEVEVQRRQAEALKGKADEQAKEIEAKVRAEMMAKAEADKLKEQVKKQEEEFSKFKEEQDARLKAQEEAFKKQLEEALAQKKGLSKNESPFKDSEPQNMRTLEDGTQIDVSKLNHEEIEEESRQAFIKAFNITAPDFGKPLTRYK